MTRGVLGISCAILLASSAGLSKEIRDAGWRFIPIDKEKWEEVMNALKGDKPDRAVDIVENYKGGVKGIERADMELLEAIVLLERGMGAIGLEKLLDIIQQYQGTEVQMGAIHEFEKYSHENPYDLERAVSVLGQFRLTKGSDEVADMIAFHAMISNINKRFMPWAKESRQRIRPDSFWLTRYNYWRALDKYKKGDIDEALKDLESMRAKLDKPSLFRWELDLNRARMLFEKKKFADAEKLWNDIAQPGRRYGLVLLEKTWSIFHQRELERAAGVLEALKSPYFNVSATPERHLLEMLIYREFCQFGYLKPVINRFREYYNPIIEKIKKGKPELYDIKSLMALVLLGTDQLTRAQYIQQLRSDQIRAETLGVDEAAKKAAKLEKFHRRKFEYEVRNDLKMYADQLLKAQDQMKLIEYVAGVAEIKNQRRVASEKSNEVNWRKDPDELAWPVKEEFWWEELPLFKVKIKDLCEVSR